MPDTHAASHAALADDERKAIAALHRLAKRWPRTLSAALTGEDGT